MSCSWEVLANDFWRGAKRLKVSDPPPGLKYASSCWLPTEWVELPLVGTTDYNHDTKVFQFGLPDGKSLNLPTCACLLVATRDAEGKDVVRPYTPISPPDMVGQFELLVKNYPGGNVSSFMHKMAIGDTIRFKHIKFNIKQQYPFNKRTISMVCVHPCQ